MRKSVAEILDYQLLQRYSKLVDFDSIDIMPPFVVAHDNVIDYISGTNPRIIFDINSVRQAAKRWHKILELLSLNAEEAADINVDKMYVLGYMYPDTYIISSIKPQLPYIAELFGFVKGDSVVIVRRSHATRKLYIEILKRLAKSVIVKPIF